jgi:hypothetical protein
MSLKRIVLEVCVDSVQSAVRSVLLLASYRAFAILNITMRAITVPYAEEQTDSRCVEISVLEGARRRPMASSVRFRKPYLTHPLWSDTLYNRY